MKLNWKDKCELAMMGKTQQVTDQNEVQKMFNYIKKVLGYEKAYNDVDILKLVNKYNDSPTMTKVAYIDCYRVYEMPCVCFCLDENPEQDIVKPFFEDYGSGYPSCFCYVFNLAAEECSEFGDVFFYKNKDGYYHVAPPHSNYPLE